MRFKVSRFSIGQYLTPIKNEPKNPLKKPNLQEEGLPRMLINEIHLTWLQKII